MAESSTEPVINQTLVHQVAALAKLDLSDAELQHLESDMKAILSYVSCLDELDLAQVEAMAHPNLSRMRLRPDIAEPSEAIEQILENAPQVADRLVKVPRIISD